MVAYHRSFCSSLVFFFDISLGRWPSRLIVMERRISVVRSLEGTGVAAVSNLLVPNSVLEAIQQGLWDFEPRKVESDQFDSTKAVPGSNEKVSILAERLRRGLPLWHPSDRQDYEDMYAGASPGDRNGNRRTG